MRDIVRIKDATMFDDFTINGIWSQDINFSSNYKTGVLNYRSSSSYDNELMLWDCQLSVGEDIPIFYGISDDNNYVTLLGCRVSNTKSSSLETAKIRVEKIIIGKKHLELANLQNIKKVSFSFFILNDWMKLPIWTEEMQRKGDEYENRFITKKVPVKSYRIESIGAKLKEGYSTSYKGDNKKVEANSEQYYSLEFDNPLDLNEIRQYVFRSVQLFYFLFSMDLPMKLFEFEYGETRYYNDKVVTDKYRVYYRQVSNIPNKLPKIYNLISYQIVSDKLGVLLDNWFREYDSMKSIIQTYVGDLQISSFVELNFLNACRNIEVFHRVFLQKKQAIPADIEVVRLELLKFLDSKNESIKSYFSKRINFTEETTLSVRIKESINSLPVEIRNKIIVFNNMNLSDSKKRFIRSCVNTRNYLTHGSSNKEKYVPMFEKVNLYLATKVLNLSIEFFVLERLGLDENILIEEFKRNRRYQVLVGSNLNKE